MKKHITIRIILVVLFSVAGITSVSAQDLFSEGNTLYQNGQYAEAAELYVRLLEEQPSAEVYYNLGNACFRQGELAQSILAYERALRLHPNYKDAKYNLRFAQSRIVDNLTDTHTFFLSTWSKTLRNQMSETSWSVLSITLFVLMLIGLLLFALSRNLVLRKSAFHISWLALLISLIAFFNAESLHRRDTLRNEAVITQGVVNAKASPDKSGTELFTLHEGTEVTITETLGDWCNVQVGNNVGWIKLSNLERI